MTKYTIITAFVTGLRRGYIRVKERGERDYIAIPATLRGKRGNLHAALEKFVQQGCTHYTVEQHQLEDSTKYCFTIYRGYKALTDHN